MARGCTRRRRPQVAGWRRKARLGIGPGAGRLAADLVTGDPTLVDPAPFRLSRFTDGSKPRPHPLAS
jgi:hypothetical protein